VDEPYEPSAGRKASLVANVPAAIALTRAAFARRRGDVEYMEVCVHTALSELTEDDEALRAFVIWYQAVVDCMHGRVVEARPALASLVPVQRAAAERGDRYLTVRPAYDLGQVEQKLGRLEAALRAYREAVELASEAGRPLPLAGEPHIGIADVLYERGELAAALRHATEGIKLCRQLAFTSQPVANGLATFARIRQAAGDPAGAWAAIGEAERVALASPRVASLLNPVPAERARLMLADDQTPKAARWAAERGLAAEDEPKYAQERDYLVLARLLLTEDQPDRALLLLDRLLTVATGQSRTGTVIEVRVLQALSLAVRGDNARALDALSEALRLGYSEDYQRVFVDEGAPMRDLLGKLVATRRDDLTVPGEYPLRLLDAFGEPDVTIRRRPAVPQPGLPEPLTAREVDVLGLLAAGKSNQRIAEELVITLDTVKKHVSHVLDKLGAANRTEAVVRGRQLGLIS
jgi:LuxR family maltose regulon positive regulatory protein